jgi:hypothetical protein
VLLPSLLVRRRQQGGMVDEGRGSAGEGGFDERALAEVRVTGGDRVCKGRE